jgi:hypothetical protein
VDATAEPHTPYTICLLAHNLLRPFFCSGRCGTLSRSRADSDRATQPNQLTSPRNPAIAVQFFPHQPYISGRLGYPSRPSFATSKSGSLGFPRREAESTTAAITELRTVVEKLGHNRELQTIKLPGKSPIGFVFSSSLE